MTTLSAAPAPDIDAKHLDPVHAEAMMRVERMGAISGKLSLGNAQHERMHAAMSSSAGLSAAEFRTLVVMIQDGRQDFTSGVLVFDRGNAHLASRAGVTERSVQTQLRSLREKHLIVADRYGGWSGDESRPAVWWFTTPEEYEGGDLYTLAARWFDSLGSTASALHRRDFVEAVCNLYGGDAVVPEIMPSTVQSAGDVAGFVDHIRAVHRH